MRIQLSLFWISFILYTSCSSSPKKYSIEEFDTIETTMLNGEYFAKDSVIGGDVTYLDVVNSNLLLSWTFDHGYGAFQN